jgi:hypothetical protein
MKRSRGESKGFYPHTEHPFYKGGKQIQFRESSSISATRLYVVT